jgi:hypothetical protein
VRTRKKKRENTGRRKNQGEGKKNRKGDGHESIGKEEKSRGKNQEKE